MIHFHFNNWNDWFQFGTDWVQPNLSRGWCQPESSGTNLVIELVDHQRLSLLNPIQNNSFLFQWLKWFAPIWLWSSGTQFVTWLAPDLKVWRFSDRLRCLFVNEWCWDLLLIHLRWCSAAVLDKRTERRDRFIGSTHRRSMSSRWIPQTQRHLDPQFR